jgi:uncharacterized alpha/beta hydrolase family protein
MTDKIVNIFNKQPVDSTLDRSELNEVIDDLVQRRESIEELLIISIDKDDEMLVRTGNMSRETAYFILGLAQLNALTQ